MILEGQDGKEMRKLFSDLFMAETEEEVDALIREIEEKTTKSTPDQFEGDLEKWMQSDQGRQAVANIGSEPENLYLKPG